MPTSSDYLITNHFTTFMALSALINLNLFNLYYMHILNVTTLTYDFNAFNPFKIYDLPHYFIIYFTLRPFHFDFLMISFILCNVFSKPFFFLKNWATLVINNNSNYNTSNICFNFQFNDFSTFFVSFTLHFHLTFLINLHIDTFNHFLDTIC